MGYSTHHHSWKNIKIRQMTKSRFGVETFRIPVSRRKIAWLSLRNPQASVGTIAASVRGWHSILEDNTCVRRVWDTQVYTIKSIKRTDVTSNWTATASCSGGVMTHGKIRWGSPELNSCRCRPKPQKRFIFQPSIFSNYVCLCQFSRESWNLKNHRIEKNKTSSSKPPFLPWKKHVNFAHVVCVCVWDQFFPPNRSPRLDRSPPDTSDNKCDTSRLSVRKVYA